MRTILVFLISILFASCTPKKESPEITALQKSIQELEAKVSILDKEMGGAPSENTESIHQERELVKSRLERLKERLKQEQALRR